MKTKLIGHSSGSLRITLDLWILKISFLFPDVLHHFGWKYPVKLSTLCKQSATKGTFNKMQIAHPLMNNILNLSIFVSFPGKQDTPTVDIQLNSFKVLTLGLSDTFLSDYLTNLELHSTK